MPRPFGRFRGVTFFREAAKKVIFFVAGPLRGGGGLNGYATKEKKNFFYFNVMPDH